MFDKVTPNLVILDIKLPKMNGYEVCKCIRKKTKIIPVVMLTAATVQEADIIRCGATTCIFKPFSVKDVINKVEYLLNYKS
jgi:DNA-binding response OmpR family regulator